MLGCLTRRRFGSGTAHSEKAEPAGQLKIEYPLDGALFPPDIAAPVFRWKDENSATGDWRIEFRFQDGDPLEFHAKAQEWTPSDEAWETIKRRSRESKTVVTVERTGPRRTSSKASATISTSKDEVGAPIFYREVNLPFRDAVKDPTRIRWRFGEISSNEQPPIILEKLPVCGNCHSFSADGKTLGMDVDYANDRGSYAIADVARHMVLGKDQVITWATTRKRTSNPRSAYCPKSLGRPLCGEHDDRSVFVPTDDLAFSQLFFPIKGILAVYDRQTRKFFALPGADNPKFVQSNPTWSPTEVSGFRPSRGLPAQAPAQRDERAVDHGGVPRVSSRRKTFLFDLYRIPFNDGKGGVSSRWKRARAMA